MDRVQSSPCKFPVVLASQRRFAHFRNVIVRNLVPAAGDGPVKFSFYRMLSDDGRVLYQSECCPSASNPTWLPMHRRAEHGANGTCHKLVLRVYSVRGCMHAHQAKCTAPASQACPLAVEQARVALEQHTDLREHFHLNLNFGANPLRNVPLNTVLFQLLDGYYGHKEQWRLFRKMRLIPQATADRGALAVLTVGDSFTGLRKVAELKAKLARVQASGTRTKARIRALLAARHECDDKAAVVEAARKRVASLRQDIKSRRAVEAAASHRLQERQRELVARTRAIRSVLSTATPALDMRKAENADVANERTAFRMIRQLLTARQLCLVSDARYVYPITEVERRRVYSIRGLILPNADLFSGDDEQVSTALGHVAHLVTLIAKYLQVPMRYAIHCVGSRSTIRDDVLRPGEQFPLFSKSQDRQRFVVAVRFLQLNITQLVAATGVSSPAPDNSAMLPKLLALFAHLLGPVLAFEARYEGKLAQ